MINFGPRTTSSMNLTKLLLGQNNLPVNNTTMMKVT